MHLLPDEFAGFPLINYVAVGFIGGWGACALPWACVLLVRRLFPSTWSAYAARWAFVYSLVCTIDCSSFLVPPGGVNQGNQMHIQHGIINCFRIICL